MASPRFTFKGKKGTYTLYPYSTTSVQAPVPQPTIQSQETSSIKDNSLFNQIKIDHIPPIEDSMIVHNMDNNK